MSTVCGYQLAGVAAFYLKCMASGHVRVYPFQVNTFSNIGGIEKKKKKIRISCNIRGIKNK